jgi:flagellin
VAVVGNIDLGAITTNFSVGQVADFTVAVNGGPLQTVFLDAGMTAVTLTAVTSDELLTEINSQLAGATASYSGDGFLQITSDTVGTASAVEYTFNGGIGSGATQLGLSLDPVTAVGADPNPDALSAGDLTINGVSISAAQASDDTASYSDAASSDKTAGSIAIAAAINKSTDDTGVTANLEPTSIVGGATTTAGTVGDAGALHLNGVEITLTDSGGAAENRKSAVAQINAVSGQTGVVAEDNGKSLTLTAADGRNIVAALDTNAVSTGIAASDFGLAGMGVSETDITAAAIALGGDTVFNRKTASDSQANTTSAIIILSSAGEIDLQGGTNGTSGIEGVGFEVGTFGGAADGTFLKDVDLSTVDGANAALKVVDNALQTINTERAQLGAIQNRFEATIQSNTLNSENLSAANSRIRDADFAAETAALSRSQVLQQAGISILAQANALPQQALSLLG